MNKKDISVANRLMVAADYSPTGIGRAGARKNVLDLADQLADTGVILKMNSILRACGYDIIGEIHQRGLEVFADLKLVDIPATMMIDGMFLDENDVRPAFVTAMANAGVKGLKSLAEAMPSTQILAVTVLTSLDQEGCQDVFGCDPTTGVQRFANIAQRADLEGLILSPKELNIITDMPDIHLDCNTPGIRPNWTVVEGDDQSRVTTPADAIAAGAKRIVVGRPITQADSPRDAVQRTLDEIAAALD